MEHEDPEGLDDGIGKSADPGASTKPSTPSTKPSTPPSGGSGGGTGSSPGWITFPITYNIKSGWTIGSTIDLPKLIGQLTPRHNPGKWFLPVGGIYIPPGDTDPRPETPGGTIIRIPGGGSIYPNPDPDPKHRKKDPGLPSNAIGIGYVPGGSGRVTIPPGSHVIGKGNGEIGIFGPPK